MNLREAVLEEIAIRHEYDVTAIKSLERVYVEQHKQRAIAEHLVSYPSLIKQLVKMIEEDKITCVDIQITRSGGISKPRWIKGQAGSNKAILVVNSI